MADQRININIGSSWNGQGLNKALQGVGGLSKEIGKATGGIGRLSSAVGQLGGAFGDMGGKAAQTIGQLTSTLGAIATGGTIGIIAAGIAGWVTVFKSLRGETKKAADDTKKYKDKMEELKKTYDEIKTSANTAITANNNLATSISNVASALKNLQAAQGNAKAIAIGAKNEQDVMNANSDEKGIVSAQGNVELTRHRGEQAIKGAETDLKTAEEKAKLFAKNLEEANNAVRNYNAQLASLEKDVEDAKRTFVTGMELKQSKKAMHRYSQRLNAAEDALAEFKEETKEGADLLAQAKDAEEKVKLANIQILTAKQNLENARAKAQADNQAAEDRLYDEEERARQESIKETWADVQQRVEQRNQRIDEENAEKKLKDAIEKDHTLQEQLNTATEDLKKAQEEYAAACRKAADAARNATWEGWAGTNNIPLSQIAGNGINGKSRYDPRNNATLNDAGYNQRVQEGMERNAQSQGFGLSARDKARQRELEAKYDRAMERGQKLSAKDQAELDELESRDQNKQKAKAARDAKKAADELKAAQEAKDQAEQQMWTNVSAIKTMMEKLGLK